MLSRFQKAVFSRPMFLIYGLVLGAVITQYSFETPKIAQLEQVKPQDSILVKPHNDLEDDFMSDAFARMRQMQKHMMDSFDSDYGIDQSVQISQHEDSDFKYVEINTEKFGQDSLEVKVENGMIRVAGQIEDVKKTQFGESKSVSSFNQVFNIPFGVDANKAEIQKTDSNITIKFPKAV